MLETIIEPLRQLYLSDQRPWMVGFSGGKDSTLVAHLVFDVVRSVPTDDRIKEIHILCTDTRVEIPAVVETIEGTLNKMQQTSNAQGLRIMTHLLRPPAEQSFWVNIIGRGYPPPNKIFRWCTQRLKIDPVNVFVENWLGREREAILHLGARRSESARRAQTLAGRELRNGLRRHPNLPRVSVSNPIEFLTTEEVWAYLLQNPSPWGGTHKGLYRLYNNAGGGECPIHIDTSTPSCGSSRFGCWTCTVVERDKASEGLLASGDERMEPLIAFRERLLYYQNPENGKRDRFRKNGFETENDSGPLLLSARKDLLKELLELQAKIGLPLITDDELFLIQQIWRGERGSDNGRGVAHLINQQRGIPMNDLRQTARLRKWEAEVAEDKGLSPETLQRLVGKIEEYSEMQWARGFTDQLNTVHKDARHLEFVSS